MASQVEIVNRGLRKLGAAPIVSMGDGIKQARIMSDLWNTVRQAELRRHNWNFAMTRTALPALAAAPAWEFQLAYQLPSDCLRLVQVNDFYVDPSATDYRSMDDSPFQLEGGQILTDYAAPLKIRYVRDITDPGAFDALFVEALASKLAYEGCEAITQSNEKKNTAANDYKMAVRDAAQADAIEKPSEGFADDSWILQRL